MTPTRPTHRRGWLGRPRGGGADRAAPRPDRLAQLRQTDPSRRSGRGVADRSEGEHASVWVETPGTTAPDLERAIAETSADFDRRVIARDEAHQRWMRLARLVEAWQRHLAVPAI